jgi:hypothetical protein
MNTAVEIENFLNIFQQKELQRIIESSKLDWYFLKNPSTDYETAKNKHFFDDVIKDSPALVHTFYQKDYLDNGSYSDLKSPALSQIETKFDLCKIFSKNIENYLKQPIILYRLQSYMFLPNPNYVHKHMFPQTDWKSPHKKLIYYINSSDGNTIIFNEKKDECKNYDPMTVKKEITPVQNKACIFDGLNYHADSPSKETTRYVITINFLLDNK